GSGTGRGRCPRRRTGCRIPSRAPPAAGRTTASREGRSRTGRDRERARPARAARRGRARGGRGCCRPTWVVSLRGRGERGPQRGAVDLAVVVLGQGVAAPPPGR